MIFPENTFRWGKSMKKNISKFLLICLLSGLIIIATACGSTESSGGNKGNETLTLKFGHMSSTDHAQHKFSMIPFSEEVEKVTDGRVKVQIYPGGALSEPAETFDSVISGIQDIGWAPAGYSVGRFQVHSVLNMPFLTNGSAAKVSEVAQKLYEEFPAIQEEYKDVKPLWFHATDEYVIFTKGKAVRNYKDVKGLKLRAPNPEGRAMIESWGATPVSLPAPEIYDALQKGVVDGVVLPMAGLKDYNLFDTVDYVTHGSFINSLFWVAINQNSWDKISKEDQEKIEEILGETQAKRAGEAFDKQSEQAINEGKEAGIEFITLSEEELQKFKDASKGVSEKWIADMEAKGIPAQEIYDFAYKLMHE